MNPLAVLTIVSSNYLHFARTLMQSVAEQHPEADRYCLIVDRDASHARALPKEFHVLELAEVDLPDGDEFLFQYNILELNTAVKPWAVETLFARGHQRVIYIDPDIVLYRPMKEVLQALDEGAQVVFTPHLLDPVTDDNKPSELDIRRAGTYNLGFCALAKSANTAALLKWWQGKLRRECIIDHDRGIFVDQSWMDLVPGLFSNIHVLRHPGYNVAYWNLAQRPVVEQQGRISVAGMPLVFFHFSGLNPSAPHSVSKHQDRFTVDKLPPAVVQLIDDYCARVIANGLESYRSIPYGYGSYADGTPIHDSDRIRFRTDDKLRGQAAGAPFACKDLLTTVVSHEPGNPYVQAIYAHLLGRNPDASGQKTYAALATTFLGRWRLFLAIALSGEARAKKGWLQRMLIWPLLPALLPAPQPQPQPPQLPPLLAKRPSPYGGLYPPEADSAINGLWVGPRLDLPTFTLSRGELEITGRVNLGLLELAGASGFALEVHGPVELIHREEIHRSGAFRFVARVKPESFDLGGQWCIIASAHFVPKQIGLGDDTRALAWQINRVTIDDKTLVDSSRSPVTLSFKELYTPCGLNLVGYISAELGLGEAVRSLAGACAASGIPYAALDVGYQSNNLQRDKRILGMAENRQFPINLLYVNADQTLATLEYLRTKHSLGDYRIGFWHWEQPRLPDNSLGAFAHLDEVWVPSTFVHDAVAPFSPVPVVKIPHALQFAPSKDARRSNFGLPEGKILVLVMYDFHSYQYRKNPQAALAAFRLAAANRDDTLLVLKTINSSFHAAARAELEREVGGMRNVVFIDDFLTRQEAWDLQSCCDILLSLHRAEGFGLAPAEMMYLGKPVIATGWSANMDFMTTDNSLPVRYKLKLLEQSVGVYTAGQLWAEADVEHAAQLLQQLLDEPELRSQLGARARQDIHRQLDPAAVGRLVRERLSMLGLWFPRLRG